jgi:hypothetical protein
MSLQEKIEETKQRLAAYIKAEQILLSGGQSYAIGNRSLTRADLKHITDMIIKLNAQLNQLQHGNRIVVQRVVPRDF